VIAALLGGIGLFLLGMVLLTDGLRSAAGDALRDVLRRFTGGTLPAVLSGAAATAVVQSSSATVLTTIGFVSAGLLTFPQAVGVVFGASLGTTSTGWIVSLLGLKLNIAAAAMPMVGIGALLRLLTGGRRAALGLALAGFGLIFVGIDVLQQGMQDLSTRIDPAAFPGATLPGRLMLVAVGIAMTVVMQSSSAAVATTLTALHTGTVGLEQAAALVVGQHVGTTVTAGLAAIGASIPARRTALAHILFNATSGALAFLLIPVLLQVAGPAGAERSDPAVVIAAFHTGFNLLGVLLLAPMAGTFSALIVRLLPERGPAPTRYLDPSVARVPSVAVEAARRTVLEVGGALAGVLRSALERPERARLPLPVLDACDGGLEETRRFLGRIRDAHDEPQVRPRHLALLHAIDHLDRLAERLRAHTPRRPVAEPTFDALRSRAAAELDAVQAWLATDGDAPPVALAEALSRAVAERRRGQRADVLEATAAGSVEPGMALEQLEAVRWLDSALYHVWRAVHHLAEAGGHVAPAAANGTAAGRPGDP
jgi:phosphate:Na+ symporter